MSKEIIKNKLERIQFFILSKKHEGIIYITKMIRFRHQVLFFVKGYVGARKDLH